MDIRNSVKSYLEPITPKGKTLNDKDILSSDPFVVSTLCGRYDGNKINLPGNTGNDQIEELNWLYFFASNASAWEHVISFIIVILSKLEFALM